MSVGCMLSFLQNFVCVLKGAEIQMYLFYDRKKKLTKYLYGYENNFHHQILTLTPAFNSSNLSICV